MNLSQIETVVQETIDSLPNWVHGGLDNIDVLVIEEPDEDHDPEGQGLLGHYLGMPLPERGPDYDRELPHVIYIFRRPHMELGQPQDEHRH